MIHVIAIDGPSGSGKGTIARRVAEALGWHLLDSGALYRLTALAARQARVDPGDESAIAALAGSLDVRFAVDDSGEELIYLQGKEVSRDIRNEECGAIASRVAAQPAVRKALVVLQRGFRKAPGLVADGRDMGTVIFPDAALKIFLTASPDERAERRYKQLKEKGIDVNLRRLSTEIAKRDQRDANRSVAPLRPAPDATVIDTTGISIEGVVDRVMSLVEKSIA